MMLLVMSLCSKPNVFQNERANLSVDGQMALCWTGCLADCGAIHSNNNNNDDDDDNNNRRAAREALSTATAQPSQ